MLIVYKDIYHVGQLEPTGKVLWKKLIITKQGFFLIQNANDLVRRIKVNLKDNQFLNKYIQFKAEIYFLLLHI